MRKFPQDLHNSQSPSRKLRHIHPFSELSSFPQSFPTQSHILSFRDVFRSNLYHSEVLTSLGFSTLRLFSFQKFRLWTWSSNTRLSLISTYSYATPSFLTFITCDTHISADSYEQWQIFLHAILTNQHRWSRPLQQIQHVQIMHLQQSVNFTSTPTSISGIYYPSSPGRSHIPNPQSTHPITRTVSMCQSTIIHWKFFCFSRPLHTIRESICWVKSIKLTEPQMFGWFNSIFLQSGAITV